MEDEEEVEVEAPRKVELQCKHCKKKYIIAARLRVHEDKCKPKPPTQKTRREQHSKKLTNAERNALTQRLKNTGGEFEAEKEKTSAAPVASTPLATTPDAKNPVRTRNKDGYFYAKRRPDLIEVVPYEKLTPDEQLFNTDQNDVIRCKQCKTEFDSCHQTTVTRHFWGHGVAWKRKTSSSQKRGSQSMSNEEQSTNATNAPATTATHDTMFSHRHAFCSSGISVLAYAKLLSVMQPFLSHSRLPQESQLSIPTNLYRHLWKETAEHVQSCMISISERCSGRRIGGWRRAALQRYVL